MFGHGSSQCAIKAFYMHCAGNHKSTEGQNNLLVKCANCNGAHKENSLDCPGRLNYMNIHEWTDSRTVCYR